MLGAAIEEYTVTTIEDVLNTDPASDGVLAALEGHNLDLTDKLAVLAGCVLCTVFNAQMRPERAREVVHHIAACLPRQYAELIAMMEYTAPPKAN
jgi:hypothetical protein